ncbi:MULTISPECIES: PACE efflux transporter [unclassified Mameliella]|uniref:PACE efflux transporter n=1 Tax=unclassified Mameliella TaxID=2630630 RepID=UPI00273DD9C0|nr:MULTISPECIES: PACE efflux transporter [unclassified Mameliella]
MRPPLDRLRHALCFELLALGLIVPLGTIAFHMPAHDIGTVGLVGSAVATLWNMLYNAGFDRILHHRRGTTAKTLRLRLLNALLFETGLLALLLPFMAWYIGISLWQALVMDLAFAGFYLAYAFAFNWAYDRVCPPPDRHGTHRAG